MLPSWMQKEKEDKCVTSVCFHFEPANVRLVLFRSNNSAGLATIRICLVN